MQNSLNLGLPFLSYNQAQKEVVVNEAFVTIDAILNNAIQEIDLNTPPQDPQLGYLCIIGSDPVDAWAKKVGQLAYYYNGWRFIQPQEGLCLWVKSLHKQMIYHAGRWQDYAFSSEVLADHEHYQLQPCGLVQQYYIEVKQDCDIKILAQYRFDHIRLIIENDQAYQVTWLDNIQWVGGEDNERSKLAIIELYQIEGLDGFVGLKKSSC